MSKLTSPSFVQQWSIETQILHLGEKDFRSFGAVCQPIYQSSTFESEPAAMGSYHDIRYARLSNTPNHLLLHQKLAALERAEAAVVTSSGMSAITTTLLTLLQAGDHLVAQHSLYGGTYGFIANDLKKYGIGHSFINLDHSPDTWKAALGPKSKVLYVEATTNPLLEIGDLEAAVAFAKKHGLVSVIDNTFPSPVNFNPLAMGFDVVVHSATKYLNGHSDLIAGAVAGSKALVQRIHEHLNHLGGSLDPHACFLFQRGLKTLTLRVERQNQNALHLAQFLEAHPKVSKVIYPGLPSHPHHQRAKKWFKDFGAMIGFEVKGGLPAAQETVDRLEIPISAPSLGGVESLITLPAATSHASLTPEQIKASGVSPSLVRVSVGIESVKDLVADFTQALQ